MLSMRLPTSCETRLLIPLVHPADAQQNVSSLDKRIRLGMTEKKIHEVGYTTVPSKEGISVLTIRTI